MIGTSKKPNSKALLLAAASAMTIAFSTSCAAVAQSSTAQSETVAIDLPSGPLGESMLALGDALGVNIMTEDSLLAGKSAPAISGNLSAQEAIDAILQGSGLVAAPNASGDFIVSSAATDQSYLLEASPEPAPSSASQAIIEDPDPLIAETIIVQGRFQQSLIDRIPIAPQELPFTLNVLDRETIDLRNFTDPIKTVSILPNLDLGNDGNDLGNPQFVSRGYVATTLVNNRVQNAIGGIGGRDDSFVERYEVLKGPASIALGPVDPGGIINLITKSPEPDAFTTIDVSIDQFGTFDGEFDINAGPLSAADFLGFRVSGAYRKFQFDAEQKFRDVLAIRPVVDLDFTDDTRAQLALSYNSITASADLANFPIFSDGSVPSEFDTSTFFGFRGDERKVEDVLAEGQLTHEFLDNLSLTIRGSYQNSDIEYDSSGGVYNYLYDDGVPGIGLNNPVVYIYGGYGNSTFSEENTFLDAQLSTYSNWWGRQHDFVIGGALSENVINLQFNFDGTPIAIPLSQINDPIIPIIGDLERDGDQENTVELNSIYAEFALRPTDWLSIIGGVRYDDQELILRDLIAGTEGTRLKTSDSTFRLGATATVIEGVNAYLSLAESFLPQSGQTEQGNAIGPARGTSYELGVKGNMFNGALRYNAALFETNRLDIGVFDRIFFQTSGLAVTRLVGEQRNRGIELSADINPAPGLNINVNFGHLDIDIIEAGDSISAPTAFPDSTASAFARYEFVDGPLSDLQVGVGVRYVGRRESSNSDIVYADYTVGGAFLRYDFSEKYSASLNINNISNELYIETAGFGNGSPTGGNSFGEPRTFRLTLRARF